MKILLLKKNRNFQLYQSSYSLFLLILFLLNGSYFVFLTIFCKIWSYSHTHKSAKRPLLNIQL